MAEEKSELMCAVRAELEHVRSLGGVDALALVTANLSAYEAFLLVVLAGDEGVPVYQAVSDVQTNFLSQAGVLSKIKAMRTAGLLGEKPGPKKSQVCLSPSETALRDLEQLLLGEGSGVKND